MSEFPNQETLFNAAVQLTSTEARAAFLNAACAGDSGLRARLDQLLNAYDQPASALEPPIAATILSPASPVTLGSPIGPYKLLQQIGEGGMGVVYMAEQTAPIVRRVALKIIKPGMDSRQVIARFEAERQALALMDHPNIARVVDAGTTEQGRPYFVMELVHGVPITQYCDDNHLTPRERLELFIPVCQAIQHAHQKGIIHRDIKPSNVMVTLHDGRPVPKVIDFGVAKAIDQNLTERTLFTQYGTLVGTLEYMSPEQAEMSALGVDTRSDIYSLGVLLYELLTGTTPLGGQRIRDAAYAEIVRCIKEEEPPKPSTRLSESGAALASISALRQTEPAKLSKLMRGDLDWIVMKCLEKDRNRRYPTANGFADDVQRYLNDEAVLASSPSAWYRFGKFARRNKRALAMAAIVASALIVATVGLAVSNVRVRAERNEKIDALAQKVRALGEREQALDEKDAALTQANSNAVEAKRQEGIAKSQEQIAREQTDLAQRRLYVSQMNLATQAWRNGELPRVLELLEEQRPNGDDADLRGFEWYFLWRQCHGGRMHLHGHDDAVLALDFSPDSQTVASASSDGTVRLWDIGTGRELRSLTGHTSHPWDVVFSPDGRLLASGGQSTPEVIVWDVNTGQVLHTFPTNVHGLAFSPDGRTLLGGGLSIRLWDVTDGTESTFPGEAGLMLGMLRDDQTIATLTEMHTDRSEVRLWDKTTGERRMTIPVPQAAAAALSSDGTRVATSSYWCVRIWETRTGKLESSHWARCDARGLAFSPDGKRIVAGYEDRRVVVRDVATGEQQGEDVHRDVVWDVAFSPDGTTIASGTLAGDIKLWDTRSGNEAVSIPIPGVDDLRFAPDGQTLLVGNRGLTRILNVATGEEIGLLPVKGTSATSADGQRAARVTDDGHVCVWDLRLVSEIARISCPQSVDGKSQIRLSSNGTQAVTFLSWNGDPTATHWILDSMQSRTLAGGDSQMNVNCAEFSPDGSLLALGYYFQSVSVWSLDSGKVRWQVVQPPTMLRIISLAFSPDSRTLAVGTDIGTVTLWNASTGEQLETLRGHTSPVNAMCFSPDGVVLATAGNDSTVRLWDPRTGQERSTLAGHRGPVSSVRFSSDGTTLATASRVDGTVRIWRSATDLEALSRQGAAFAKIDRTSVTLDAVAVPLPSGAIGLTETELRDALSLWPNETELQDRLDRLVRETDRRQASLGELVEPSTGIEAGILKRAKSFDQQRKYVEAEAAYRQAIQLNPVRPWSYDRLGWMLMSQQRFAEAEPAFRAALELRPQLASSLFGLGRSLHSQEKSAEAIAPLLAFIELDPTNPHAHGSLGWALLNTEQFADAELAFRKLIHLKPDSATGHFGFGKCLYGQGKLPEAETALREALRLNPDDPSVKALLEQLLDGLRNEKERPNEIESDPTKRPLKAQEIPNQTSSLDRSFVTY